MVLSDNLGIILAGHFTPLTGSTLDVIIKDSGGVDRTVTIYGASSNNWIQVGGKGTRIGKGSTPATGQDFDLENPFADPPENGKINSASATYIAGSGETNQTTQFAPMGGNDSITEVVQQITLRDTGGVDREVQISRIVVSPAVPFLIGQQVNLNNKVVF